MIGAFVQYILNKGFLLDYRYGGENSYGCHVFKLQKIYKGRVFERAWIISDTLVSDATMRDVAFADLRYRMRQIDRDIETCRLLDYPVDEAL